MRGLMKFVPLVVLAGVVGCDLATAPEVRSSGSQYPLSAEWRVSVTGLNGAPITGQGVFRDYRAYYEGEFSISNGAPNTNYNWRIYRGTCENSSTTIAGNSTTQYTPLATGGNGSASVQRTFSGHLTLLGHQQYNLRVLSGTAISTTVACGNLQRQ